MLNIYLKSSVLLTKDYHKKQEFKCALVIDKQPVTISTIIVHCEKGTFLREA